MLIPYSNLKKYLDLDKPIEIVADALTMLGLEVDRTFELTPDFSSIVLARIVHIEAINTELNLATITDGSKEAKVVTSATNCHVGDIVPWAKPGATLFGKKIVEKELAQKQSEGLLLSMKELKLGEDHEGIWVVSGTAEPGMDLASELTQMVLEISLTPNLGHCQSVLGIARELSAAFAIPLHQIPSIEVHKTSLFSIEIDNTQDCSHYAGLYLDSIHVEPSKLEDVKELFGFGQLATNNVVDAANLVMLNFGQPLHTFDANQIGRQIHISSKKATFHALDDKEYPLEESDVTILSEGKVLALAGIMGGQNSKVTKKTTSLFVESAFFHPMKIRKTAKRLNLKTQASLRFEKGVDPEGIERALQQFGQYLGLKSISVVSKHAAPKQKKARIRFARCNQILGSNLAPNQIETLLTRLSFDPHMHADYAEVHIPTYRFDIEEEIDLIEEVGRLYGFEHLPKRLPLYTLSSEEDNPVYTFEKKIRQLLLRSNCQECVTPDLIDEKLLQRLQIPIEPTMLVRLKQAQAKQYNTLRPSLLPCLFQVIEHNFAKGADALQLFELGKIHLKAEHEFIEPLMATWALAEKKAKTPRFTFFDIKGKCEALFQALNIDHFEFKPSKLSSFHPHYQASIYAKELLIGEIGMLHPAISEHSIWFAELNVEDLLRAQNREKIITMPSIYPSTSRDLTLQLDQKTSYKSILDEIEKRKGKYFSSVQFIDMYQPNEALKNITLRFTYQKQDGTLQFAEAQNEHDKMVASLTEKFQTR